MYRFALDLCIHQSQCICEHRHIRNKPSVDLQSIALSVQPHEYREMLSVDEPGDWQGLPLLDQKAALVAEYLGTRFSSERMHVIQITELWLLEDMTFASILCTEIYEVENDVFQNGIEYLKYGLAEIARREKEPRKEIPVVKCDIAELDLRVKAFNCLRRGNITMIEQLTLYSKTELRKLRNMGVGTLAEVERKLADKGLALRQDDE